jgi:hypothetical protein
MGNTVKLEINDMIGAPMSPARVLTGKLATGI